MQLAHGSDGAVVEVFAKHKWPGDGLQCRDVAGLAGDGARLDPSVALPLTPLADQIVLQCIKTHRQWAGVTPGPQAHIDPEHPAIGRGLVQQRDQSPAQAGEELMVAQAAGGAVGATQLAVLGINKNQVDIGRHIEFQPAEFAHAQHDHSLWPQTIFGHRFAILGMQQALEQLLAVADGAVGQRAHAAADFLQAGLAAQIARKAAQHDPCPQPAQHLRQTGLGVGVIIRTMLAHELIHGGAVPGCRALHGRALRGRW